MYLSVFPVFTPWHAVGPRWCMWLLNDYCSSVLDRVYYFTYIVAVAGWPVACSCLLFDVVVVHCCALLCIVVQLLCIKEAAWSQHVKTVCMSFWYVWFVRLRALRGLFHVYVQRSNGNEIIELIRFLSLLISLFSFAHSASSERRTVLWACYFCCCCCCRVASLLVMPARTALCTSC